MHIWAKKKVEKDEDSISVPAKYIHTILWYLLSLNCAKTEALKEEQRNRDFLPVPKCNKKPSYKHKLFYFFFVFFWRYSVLKDAEHFLPTMHWQCTCKPTHRVINVASTSFTWSHPLPKLVVLIWGFPPPRWHQVAIDVSLFFQTDILTIRMSWQCTCRRTDQGIPHAQFAARSGLLQQRMRWLMSSQDRAAAAEVRSYSRIWVCQDIF